MKTTPSFTAIASASLLFAGTIAGLAQDPAAAPEKRPVWTSSASLQLTLTRGNSESITTTVDANTSRKGTPNEYLFGASGSYGKTKNLDGTEDKTVDTYSGFAQYNRLFTERWYAYGKVNGLYDHIAGIYYRVTLSPGLGYYFIKRKATDLSFELGPGYVFEKLTPPVEENDYVTLRVGQKFNYSFNERVRFEQSAEWLPQVEEDREQDIDAFENYIINFEARLTAALTADKKLGLIVSFKDTYDSEPAPGRKENDMILSTGVSYKF